MIDDVDHEHEPDGMTLEQVARVLGVTRQRVEQLEKRALQKLKKSNALRLLGLDAWELRGVSASPPEREQRPPRRTTTATARPRRASKPRTRAYLVRLVELLIERDPHRPAEEIAELADVDVDTVREIRSKQEDGAK